MDMYNPIIRRTEMQIQLLRNKYPGDVKKIEDLASRNSQMSHDDVDNLILDLGERNLFGSSRNIGGRLVLGLVGTVLGGAATYAAMTSYDDFNIRSIVCGGATIASALILVHAIKNTLEYHIRQNEYSSKR